jgi:hypothetical protein
MELNKEIWRAVVEYEGKYEVSNMGRIRSLYDNHGNLRVSPRILKLSKKTHSNHLQTFLYDDKGRKQTKQVHRLMLEAFVGPCPDGMESSHLNNIASDNRLENLRWETRQENMGRFDRSKCSNTKLNKQKILEIRRLRKDKGYLNREIGAIYNVSAGAISNICNRKSWKHI